MRISAMKNDLDLMRQILETVRNREDVLPKAVEIPGNDPVVVARHVERLYNDGMVDGFPKHFLSDSCPTIEVRDLTTAGHQLLSALESEDVWSQLKTAVNPKNLGALSVKRLARLAGDLAEKSIRKQLGLD